jgi:hypothetical protein
LWASYSSLTDKFFGTPPNPDENYTEDYFLDAHDPFFTYTSAYLQITVIINLMPYLNGVPSFNITCYEEVFCQANFSQWAVDEAGDIIKYNGTNASPTIG